MEFVCGMTLTKSLCTILYKSGNESVFHLRGVLSMLNAARECGKDCITPSADYLFQIHILGKVANTETMEEPV